jgi:NADH-quinone oxidoreductase subunit K
VITPEGLLLLGAILFCIGAYGVLARRQIIIMLMSIEIMLAAVSLTLVALARVHVDPGGQAFVMFNMGVSAAEAAVGLAILVAFYRSRQSVDADDASELRG